MSVQLIIHAQLFGRDKMPHAETHLYVGHFIVTGCNGSCHDNLECDQKQCSGHYDRSRLTPCVRDCFQDIYIYHLPGLYIIPATHKMSIFIFNFNEDKILT